MSICTQCCYGRHYITLQNMSLTSDLLILIQYIIYTCISLSDAKLCDKFGMHLTNINVLYSDGFPKHINTINKGLPIVYLKGSQVDFSK